jgi:hypothetical protein
MSVPQAIYLGPGAGLARLHQLGHALEGGSDRHSSEYWRSFGNQFFTPDAIMHIVLWNPTTKERKGFGKSNTNLLRDEEYLRCCP